ncbi:DUF6439 family protein [Leptothermofonsia sichuanensis]|jgi:hypothetical protein|uniref:DUF6439 family protein n=1 Tax=Leptothermofonsia sichuanensis TaxID=2917832 RepID=UPI001CECBC26|nr:DUF6439 family protein [Leptothermofonsia sichuanensis]
MVDTSVHAPNSGEVSKDSSTLRQFTAVELAQALLEKLAITDGNWHRLKSNRRARAGEQAAAALVFLLKDQPEEALPRLQQAVGWLDHSISAPPCPTHGNR